MLSAEDLQRLGKFRSVTPTSTATEFLIARCPARTIPLPRTSLAEAVTTRRPIYSERPDDYKRNMDRLNKKYERPRSTCRSRKINYANGSEDRLPRLRDDALGDHRIAGPASARNTTCPISYFRLRALPFTKHLVEFFEKHDRVYVVEQNRDGQMAMLIKLELPVNLIGKIRSIRHYSGIPIDARFVTDEVVAAEKGEKK